MSKQFMTPNIYFLYFINIPTTDKIANVAQKIVPLAIEVLIGIRDKSAPELIFIVLIW